MDYEIYFVRNYQDPTEKINGLGLLAPHKKEGQKRKFRTPDKDIIHPKTVLNIIKSS